MESPFDSTSVTPRVIDYAVARIVEEIDPVRIVPFGSQASGLQEDDSDLDLLIIHDSDQPNREIRLRFDNSLIDRRFSLDLIVCTLREAEHAFPGIDSFIGLILNTGKVIYERQPLTPGRKSS